MSTAVDAGSMPATAPMPLAEPQRVLGEQVTLLCRNWTRVPFALLALTAYLSYLVWDFASPVAVLGWALLTVLAGLVRSELCKRVLRGRLAVAHPGRWASGLAAFAVANGAISGASALLFFGSLPIERQAVLTMLICCWGAGAIAANGPYPPAYYAFATPLFLQIIAAWYTAHIPGVAYISLLLVLFLLFMVVFARDHGRVIADSIRLRYANEQLIGQKDELIGLMRTAFQKAEEARSRAEEASRSKSQFLAAASHDLRQPLHALSLFTAVLNDVTEDSRVRQVGQSIERSVQSLDRLFGALLDLSKLDAGVVTPTLAECDLGEMLERLSAEYRGKAREKRLEYHSNCPALWIRTDPILLERIVRNLLENAIRFTKAGHIRLQAGRLGHDVQIAVSDTGIGIPASEQTRVFEEFYQLHNPGRDRTEGLGLGLSIVRRLVDLLGYRMALASAPGEGTTFTIDLPGVAIGAPSATSRSSPPSPVESASELASLDVLVLDDDAEVREAMESMLERWGCRALVAASLDEAIELADAVRPACMLSDLRLAGGASGIDAISALRARLGPLPAALITGDIAADKLLEVRSTGLPLLHKPVQAGKLLHMLIALARQRT